MDKTGVRDLSPLLGSSSADVIPGLPNEIAAIILALLPTALRARLRRVCRAWHNALQQPFTIGSLKNTLHISEVWTLFLFKDNSVALYDPLLQHLSSPIPYLCDSVVCAVRLLGAIGSQVFFLHHELGGSYDILCLDTASMQWQSDLIPLWSNNASVVGFTSAVVDGHLWVLGGGGDDGSEVCRFDVKSRVWERMPNMHEWHLAAAAAVLQGRLHVIGGAKRHDGFNSQSDGEIWDPRTGEWMLEPALWPPAQLDEHAGRCSRSGYRSLVVAGEELWVVLSCDGLCTAKILSCVPTTGSSPVSWRREPITSSVKFRPGHVTVLGNIHL